jgi:glyoxylase-like metal-dependent hydrolase (beta-lactamase superfamily II)
MALLVQTLTTGPFQENGFLVARADGRAGVRAPCVLIDPGDEPERWISLIEELGLKPELILNTHGHLDHVGAVAELRRHFGIPFAIHPGDAFLLRNINQQARMYGLDGYEDPEVDIDLVAGEPVEAAGIIFDVIYTPGHSPGHVTFRPREESCVFSGDCLFMGSIGRSDLPGGDPATLRRTLRDIFLALPDETIVYCGHGSDTTIARERATNPFLTGAYPW